MRAEIAEGELPPRNPIRGAFAGCRASANVPMARRTSVTIQRSLLIMALTIQRNGLCHKTRLMKITNFMDEECQNEFL